MSRPCGMTPSRWPSVWKPSWVTNNPALSKAVPAIGTSCLVLMGHSRWAWTGGTYATGSRSSTTSKSLWARVRGSLEKMKQTRRPPAKRAWRCWGYTMQEAALINCDTRLLGRVGGWERVPLRLGGGLNLHLKQLSLSRLNHGLPRGEDEPGMREGTADVLYQIADVYLPEAASVL
jgi:hypothetical protein